MNIDDLRELIDLMNDNDLLEIEVEEAGRKVRLRKKEDQPPATVEIRPPMPLTIPVAESLVEGVPIEQARKDIATIQSPMVGTFYRASGSDADAYVEVGDPVTEETVVCIIEAMKVMNEIKAETEISGTVHEILVANGEPVEYGQPLFHVYLGGDAAGS